MDNAAALNTQRKLTLTFPPHGLKIAGAALQQRAAHKATVPQHKADPRQAVVAGWWLPSLGHGSNSLHLPPPPSPAALVLQQLVFYSRAL